MNKFVKVMSLLAIGSCLITGCGKSKNNNDTIMIKDETLQLSEAKDLIVNSLESEDEVRTYSHTKMKNRNIITKLKNASFSITSPITNISGYIEKTGSEWTKYNLASEDIQEYYDGENVYTKMGNDFNVGHFDEAVFKSELYGLDAIYLNILFLDDAWDTIYNNEVEKKGTDYGFELNLDINMSKYVDYVNFKGEEMGLGSEGLFGSGEILERNKNEGNVLLKVKFDRLSNIIGLDYASKTLGSNGISIEFMDTVINLTKSDKEITEPEWEEDATHSFAPSISSKEFMDMLNSGEEFVVFIGSKTCGHCKTFRDNTINTYLLSNPNKVIYYYETDDESDPNRAKMNIKIDEMLSELPRDRNIQGLATPTTILVRNGKIVDAIQGAYGMDGGINYIYFTEIIEGGYVGRTYPKFQEE